MNTPASALGRSLRSASRLVLSLSQDLQPQDYLYRMCAGANCPAWIIGHLVLSSRGMMKRLGVVSLPELPEGFETRFARDELAPNSDDYGDVSVLLPLFEQHHDLFAGRIETLTPEQMATPLPQPHPMFGTLGEMAAFAPVHVAVHAGHISLIRRGLGRKPLV